jgi:hypothetical protein
VQIFDEPGNGVTGKVAPGVSPAIVGKGVRGAGGAVVTNVGDATTSGVGAESVAGEAHAVKITASRANPVGTIKEILLFMYLSS